MNEHNAAPARMRVLLIAEAANPEWVSVPLVGWSLAAALRRRVDAHIVTQTRNRDAFLRAGLIEGTDFTAIDSEAVAAPLYRLSSLLRMGEGKGWTMVTAVAALAYPYFERLVWRQFGPRIRAGEFDIVHRVTPLSPTIASSLAPRVAAAGVPFVLGPLNGGVPWPKGFDAERRREREWLSYVRGAYKLNPAHARMLRATALILAGSRHTAGEIPTRFRHKVRLMPENGIDPARFNLRAAHAAEGPLRGCFVGRLVPYKGADMLLEAAAPLLRAGRMELDIVGDGPMREDLGREAEGLGLTGSVRFHGNLPHARVQDVLAQAHLLTFPSIREFGGGVVLEAMALGVVPLVVDYAGPAELVTPETGYLVPIGPRHEIIARLGQQLHALAEDRGALPEKSRAAVARVAQQFTWDAKAGQIAAFYEELRRDPVAAPA